MENNSSAPFCTCDKFKCPLHPVNHDKGCTLCIAKNLRAREIPNCYFDLLGAEGGRKDDSLRTFAELVMSADGCGCGKEV